MFKAKAATIIEMLISIAILSFIVWSVFIVLNVGDMTWHSEIGLLDLQRQTRQTMEGMIREIRQSNPSNTTITNGGARVEFYVPDASNSISYYLSNDYIIREHPLGTTKELMGNVNNLCFCWDSTSNVCKTDCTDVLPVRLSATKTIKRKQSSFSLLGKVKLRNE